MDQPGLDADEHARALAGLNRLNWICRTDAVLWASIRGLACSGGRPFIRVLDVATGGGGVPIALARRAARAGQDLRIDGCDRSPAAVRFAAQNAALAGTPVRFFELDALKQSIPQGYDVVTCSLFLHHLDEAKAESLLRRMAAAADRLLLVDDLERGATGYALTWIGTRVFSRSPIVWHDGLVSAAAALTLSEARALAVKAGLKGARLTCHWSRRYLLSWSRDGRAGEVSPVEKGPRCTQTERW
jgi:2-polyprenyl-3-methyl-5-hydroxy-6-metoxy-1,4-benzoquinol methylase